MTRNAASFTVAEVGLATSPLPEISYREAVSRLICTDFEACSPSTSPLVEGNELSPLVAAVHRAFTDHRPLVLTPDVVWFTLVQGVAAHIRNNAEQLRDRFVRFEGKRTITVRRDDFVKNKPDNPWPELFGEFSDAIEEEIGKKRDLLVASFTTTGAIEKAAFAIVLMDAVSSYFDFELMTLCGIPKITLEGTADDWHELGVRFERLADLDLDWWVEPTLPVLQQFERASRGDVDADFWRSMYKFDAISGGAVVNGWFQTLFPYVQQRPGSSATVRNEFLDRWQSCDPELDHGVGYTKFPSPLACGSFRWVFPRADREFAMQLLAGIVGVRQDRETMALCPEMGWVVRDAPAPA